MLRLVAKYADAWNFNGDIGEFDETVEVLKGHCRDVGRDFSTIRLTAMGNGLCYENEAELAEFKQRVAKQGISVDRLLSITGCKGTREQCVEFLRGWKKKGCDALVFFLQDIATLGDGRSQAENFKRDILPHV